MSTREIRQEQESGAFPMSKRRQAGYDQAKHQHEAGLPIAMILLGFRTMPASQYSVGGLEYLTEQLAKEASRG